MLSPKFYITPTHRCSVRNIIVFMSEQSDGALLENDGEFADVLNGIEIGIPGLLSLLSDIHL